MDESMGLKKLLATIKQNKWWLMGGIAFSVFLMSLYLWFVATPIYQSNTQLLISQTEAKETPIQSQDIQANLELINTYSAIVTSPRILEEVGKELNNRYSEERLVEAIKVSNASNSQIIEIIVEDRDPNATVEIANTTANVFKDQILEIMKVNNITVLSNAKKVKNPKPIRPQKALMLTLSLFIGIVVGIICVFVETFFDRSVKGPNDIQYVLGINLLGTINTIKEND